MARSVRERIYLTTPAFIPDLLTHLVPVSGLLIAMSGFGERLNLLQAGGVVLILTAVALSVFGGWFGASKRTNPPRGKSPSEPR